MVHNFFNAFTCLVPLMDWSNKHLHFHSTHLQQHTLVLNSEPVLCWLCSPPLSLSLVQLTVGAGLLDYLCTGVVRGARGGHNRVMEGRETGWFEPSLFLSPTLSHIHTHSYTHTHKRDVQGKRTPIFFSAMQIALFLPMLCNYLRIWKNMKHQPNYRLFPTFFFL